MSDNKLIWLKDDYDDYLIYDLLVFYVVKLFVDNFGIVLELLFIRVIFVILIYIYFFIFLCGGEGGLEL